MKIVLLTLLRKKTQICFAISAFVVSLAQPALISAGASVVAGLFIQLSAHARNTEVVAEIASGITVRIEGATQGSGTLVKREGDTYTILTAWHVVRDHVVGEQLDIYTPDGRKHQLNQGSIQKIGQVDLAIFTFRSSNLYELAQVGTVKSVPMGSAVFVAGYPLPSNAVPMRMLRFLTGNVIANASLFFPKGYQLLYDNQTLPGMSGGAVLNSEGQLVGVHGQAEIDIEMTEQEGIYVKTGTNQAVPITYYSNHIKGAAFATTPSQIPTSDDLLLQAKALLGKSGAEQEIIRLVTPILKDSQNPQAYFYRAYAKAALGDKQGAIADLDKAIEIYPTPPAYFNRGNSKSALGDKQGAILDFSQAIALNPKYAPVFYNRGKSYMYTRQPKLALLDFQNAIKLDRSNAEYFVASGNALAVLGKTIQAFDAFKQASQLDPLLPRAWVGMGLTYLERGYTRDACKSFSIAEQLKSDQAYRLKYKFCR